MDISIKESIERLEKDIKEKQNQINLIKSINFDEKIDEEKWHAICETPLRNSNLLAVFLKNIFPDAKDINVGCNYVMFTLYGFICALPTLRCNGIEVNTDWYKKDRGEPKIENMYFDNGNIMKKYFDALDNHESWKILFKYRLPEMSRYQIWVKFLLWFCKYKWKDPHRKRWEEEFKKEKEEYERNVIQYHIKRDELHKTSERFVNELLPELYTFSNNIRKYSGCWVDIKDIIEYENLK